MEKKNSNALAVMKLLCAFFVVILHAMSHGNTLANVEVRSVSYYVCWLLEALAYVAVNVFMLSSGYFQVHKSCRPSKVILIVFQVLFYTAAGFVIYAAVTRSLSMSALVKSVLPISNEAYGFATAYIGVYLISPLINSLVLRLNDRKRIALIGVIVICLSLYPTININSDYLGLNFGASFFWYSCLYFIGACIRVLPLKERKPWVWLTGYLGFSMLSAAAGFIAREAAMLLNLSFHGEGILLHYNSFTVLCASVCFLLLFASVGGKSVEPAKKTQKAFRTITATTLGVYLLHDNFLLREFIWAPIQNKWNVGFVVGYAIILFIACVFCDVLRIWLFQLLRIDRLSGWLADKIQRFFAFCSNKLNTFLIEQTK